MLGNRETPANVIKIPMKNDKQYTTSSITPPTTLDTKIKAKKHPIDIYIPLLSLRPILPRFFVKLTLL